MIPERRLNVQDAASPPSDERIVAAALACVEGLSLREAADRLGVSHQQVSRLRKGEPRYSIQATTRTTLVRFLKNRRRLPEPLPKKLTQAERERLREMAEGFIGALRDPRERLIERVEEMRRALEGID